MAGDVRQGAVPLSVLPVDRRFKHDGAIATGAGERRVHVGDADPNDVGDLARLRRGAFSADVGDDHGTVVADGQLGAMALADPRTLDKAKCGAQECNRGANVGVDEYGHDRRRWHGPVVFHGRPPRYHLYRVLLGACSIRYGHILVKIRAGANPPTPKYGRRQYRSPVRQAQARRTRARILEAAAHAFRSRGYTGATVAAVAEAAGVSVAAVELAFPTKADLLKAAIDVAIAGDDEPVAVLERPWAASARAALDAAGFLDAVATILVPAAERSDALVLTALEGARGDDRLVPLAEQLRAQRAVTAAWIVDGLTAKTSLRAGLDRSEAIDIVWLLMDPAVYERLTTARHWRPDRFGRFFADGVVRLLTEARPA